MGIAGLPADPFVDEIVYPVGRQAVPGRKDSILKGYMTEDQQLDNVLEAAARL